MSGHAEPAATASARSRSGASRAPARRGISGSASSTRFGSQRRPSRMRTVVTISTSNWVTARSGADSQTKVMQVTSPAPPTARRAPRAGGTSPDRRRRWRRACPEPRHRRRPDRRQGSEATHPETEAVERPAPAAKRDEDEQPQLRLQPAGAKAKIDETRPAPRHGDHRALEDALALSDGGRSGGPSSQLAR
jgi:hypothetical protein